jgi:GNAT superfamily N-acetyltransferase
VSAGDPPRPAIAVAGEGDLVELLALMRAYCDFYDVAPTDEALLEMSRALVTDPEREGVQLIARAPGGEAVGFATIFWSWSTTRGAARIGVMNDLFVAPHARGAGAGRVGEALIAACAERCRAHGAVALTWQTAFDNERAQALYDRIGAQRSQWLDYDLPV